MEDATAAQLAPFLARYGLVVQLSNSKGRCLIASRAFKQGEYVAECSLLQVLQLLVPPQPSFPLFFLIKIVEHEAEENEADTVCFVFLHRSGGACAGALCCSLGWQLAAQAMRSVFFTVKQSEEMLSMQECFLLLHSMPGTVSNLIPDSRSSVASFRTTKSIPPALFLHHHHHPPAL